MIYHDLARYARERPNALAILQSDGIASSYLQEFQALNALMAVLRETCPQIEHQQPVGVACKSPRLHALLLLALEALGIATISYVQPIDAGVATTVSMCGLFIAEERPHNAREFCRLDRAFFDKAALATGKVTVAPAIWTADQTVRYLTTSGSTGRPKVMALSYEVQRQRIERRTLRYGLNSDTRLLVATVMTATVLYRIRSTFMVGGAAIFLNQNKIAEHLSQATELIVLPIHLADILRILPPDHPPSPQLKLYCVGAELGAALRRSAMMKLGATIFCPYGTNEMGWVSTIDADGLGTLEEGVEIEVVDDDFKVVPHGTEGRIRIRSPEGVKEYLDPLMTQEMFIDGWFYPGDLGVVPQEGQMRVTGRSEAILNFGGIKYSPEVIEQLIAEFAQADDVAVCGSTNADGIDELQIAVVLSRLDDQALAQGVLARVGRNFAAIHLHRLESIPRNASGKVQRALLSEQLKARQSAAQKREPDR